MFYIYRVQGRFEKQRKYKSLHISITNFCNSMDFEEFNNKHTTILIIDEIQESHIIYNSIRALQEDLNCHIVVSGSYLGKILNSKYFKPAGNVWEIEMLPLSFSEFCTVFKSEDILTKLNLFGKSESKDYNILYELYLIYIQIGGYPAIVYEYMRSKSIDNCMGILETLIHRFTEESASYFNNGKCEIIFENIYKAAFISIASEKKGTSSKDIETLTNFVKESTKEHVSRTEINNAITWLKYSKIIGSCELYRLYKTD